MNAATAQTADPFDLVAFAEAHRLSVRNIADGYPCPPVRRRRRRGHKPAFIAPAGREDVIICKSGYVSAVGGPLGTGGFCILCDTSQQLTGRLKPVMEAVGAAAVTLTQVGYSECAGYVPLDRIDALLRAMGVRRRAKRPHGAALSGAEAIESAEVGIIHDRVRSDRFTPDGEARGRTPNRAISLTTTVR